MRRSSSEPERELNSVWSAALSRSSEDGVFMEFAHCCHCPRSRSSRLRNCHVCNATGSRDDQVLERLDQITDRLRARYRGSVIARAIVLADPQFTRLRSEHDSPILQAPPAID